MSNIVEVEVTVSRTRTIHESYTVSFAIAEDAELWEIHDQAQELADADSGGWVDTFGGQGGVDIDDTEYEYEITNEEVLKPKEES